jgi:hypothetical protein
LNRGINDTDMNANKMCALFTAITSKGVKENSLSFIEHSSGINNEIKTRSFL